VISRRQMLAGSASLGLLGALAACGDDSDSDSGSSGGAASKLRLGFFPNITHATALVGVSQGLFKKSLGKTALSTSTFNAGPAAIEQIFANGIDATYVGPNPTVNAFVKSKGEEIRVIAGAASGGVAFVVKDSIKTAADLKGKKIGTPQLGNTQDVALRYWLKQQGLKTTTTGGGDVNIQPQENAQILEKYTAGALDGAWVPEPYVSRLLAAGGHVLVDERTLWPGGKFVITNLIVRTEYLKKYPETVKALLQGHVAANDAIAKDAAAAQQAVSDEIGKLTGKPLKLSIIKKAWPSLTFLNDPIPSSLTTGADHAVEVGLLKKPDLKGLYDLKLLNEVLKAKGETAVTQP
jgi:NitT/TauT family transport system substrate-binding protein